MINKRILVTAANGDIANAVGRTLLDSDPSIKIVGCDASGIWPGGALFSTVSKVPLANDPSYVKALGAVVRDTGADVVIPCSEPELHTLAHAGGQSFEILMNDTQTVLCFLDKLETNIWLMGIGLESPKTTTLADATVEDLPVIVKPRFGSGSRGIEFVKTIEQLECAVQNRVVDIIAQELISEDEGEFTCAIFKHRDAVRTIIMRRKLVGGITGSMVVEDNPAIEGALHMIANALPCTAAVNVQLRLKNGKPMVFEINPRLSSTVMMRHLVGFSDALWWLNTLSDVNPREFSCPVGMRVYRTYGELVISPEGKID